MCVAFLGTKKYALFNKLRAVIKAITVILRVDDQDKEKTQSLLSVQVVDCVYSRCHGQWHVCKNSLVDVSVESTTWGREVYGS